MSDALRIARRIVREKDVEAVVLFMDSLEDARAQIAKWEAAQRETHRVLSNVQERQVKLEVVAREMRDWIGKAEWNPLSVRETLAAFDALVKP